MKQKRSLVITTIASIILVLGISGSIQAQAGRSEGLVNPDLASDKELLALPHMNATIVKGIMERRPFVRMADLDSFLAQSLNKSKWRSFTGRCSFRSTSTQLRKKRS